MLGFLKIPIWEEEFTPLDQYSPLLTGQNLPRRAFSSNKQVEKILRLQRALSVLGFLPPISSQRTHPPLLEGRKCIFFLVFLFLGIGVKIQVPLPNHEVWNVHFSQTSSAFEPQP